MLGPLDSLQQLHQPVSNDDVVLLEESVWGPHLGCQPVLNERLVALDRHLIGVLGIGVVEESVS